MEEQRKQELESLFCPYEQELALKELGFDEPCFAYRDEGAEVMIKYTPNCVISVPTYSQAFRWFRENRHLKFFIKEDDFRESVYEYGIKEVINITGFKTYEQAELECLKELIEICRELK
jgi:hypothetical protein